MKALTLNIIARYLLFLWFPISCGPMFWGQGQAFGMSVHNIVVLGFYACGLLFMLARPRGFRIRPMLLVLFLYALISGLSYNYGSVNFWLKIASFGGVIILSSFFAEYISFERFICIGRNSLIFFFLVSIVFVVAFWGVAVSDTNNLASVQSFYAHKNTYGRFVYILIFFYLSHLLLVRGGFNAGSLLAVLLAIVVIFFTNSRTSLFVSFVAILVMLILRSWPALLLIARPGRFLLIFLAVSLFLFGFGEFQGIGSSLDSFKLFGLELELTGRATIWAAVIGAINENDRWLFGYGLEGFYFSPYIIHLSNIGLGSFVPSDSHNGYLDLLLNFGLVGVFIYCAIIYVYMRNVESRKQNLPNKIIFVVFLSIYLVSNLTESFFVKTSNITSFILMMFFIYSYSAREEYDELSK